MSTSPSHDRVIRAFEFLTPDRIPRYDSFWDFPEEWERDLGTRESLVDIAVWCPSEGAFTEHSCPMSDDGNWVTCRDDWGRVVRTQKDAYFSEVLSVPIPLGTDPDSVIFDSPDLESRYLRGSADMATAVERMEAEKTKYCVFGKTGGPYLRTAFVRGEEQFLTDIAGDPSLAKVLADKMADHLAAVGVAQLKHWDLFDTGIWIFDDMAYNASPMFSPDAFEHIFLPGYRRMIRAFKDAGATYVVLHSDGNILPILEMLVDAGIDGLNPLERRANMNPAAIREKYPNLVLIGGMCNSKTLLTGSPAEISAEAKALIDIGRNGGLVIGTHSISPEIPLANFQQYHRTCLEYGQFT